MVELIWDNKKEMLEEVNSEDFLKTDKCFEYHREESKNFDTTENLYIEGDNLEALKLLQKDYNNKIKMIYIDPPYNTEKKFIYNDTFRNKRKKECRHSGWLNMMYPRLRLARNLLKEDGVIFISIDDYEMHNLREICDEIFGEENCINNRVFIWNIPNGTNKGFIARAHEYILAYSKNINMLKPFTRDLSSGEEISEERCTNTPTADNPTTEIVFKKGLKFLGEDCIIKGVIGDKEPIEVIGEMIFEKGMLKRDVKLKSSWRNKEQIIEYMSKGIAFDEKGQEITEIFFSKEGKPKYKKKLIYTSPKSIQLFKTNNDERKLNDTLSFSNPKPSSMLSFLISLLTKENDIILDFFSGSGITAQAIIKKNSEDMLKRKYILIQLPENLDKTLNSVTGKAKTNIESMIRYLDSRGKKHKLSEIGKERIRIVGDKIVEENKDKEGIEDLDIGFKVIKIK